MTDLACLRGGQNPNMIPYPSGQIENYSTNVAVQVLEGGNANFVCLDPAVNNP
jgi:hypothetical protein